ncbi:hypothetical protein AAHB33_05525 [Paenarthrobacter sp. S56]
MYTTGITIDEQKIDPDGSLLPLLWFGFLIGPVIVGFGVAWLKRRRG